MSDFTTNGYTQNGQHLRADMVQALERYVNNHIEPGGFLYAALTNNFKDAVTKADSENAKCLFALAMYMIWEMPSVSQGSVEAVEAWLAQGEKS